MVKIDNSQEQLARKNRSTISKTQEPPQQDAMPTNYHWVGPTFVWGIWTLMLCMDLAFIARYACNVPFSDDWSLIVPFITGAEPITPSYLWQQECEHRYPLPKALVLGLMRLSGGDFRGPAVFGILALGGIAFAMIRVAKGLRGWTSFADAFIPLALLHSVFSGSVNYRSVNWAWSYAYLVPTLVASVLLLVIVSRGGQLRLWTAILAGLCLVLLPLCSAAGMLYLPPLMLWLLYSSFLLWRSSKSQGKRNSLILVSSLLITIFVVVAYFIDYSRDTAKYAPPNPGIRASVKCCLGFLAASIGPAAHQTWPFSGYAMLGLFILSAGILVAVSWQGQDLDRSRALGLLFFMSSLGLLTLGIGFGRAASGPGEMKMYFQLAAPVLCCIYLSWVLLRKRISLLAQAGLFACLSLTALFNVYNGLQAGRQWHSDVMNFVKDLEGGDPPYVLMARHGRTLDVFGASAVVDNATAVTDYMYMLRRARFGPFQYLQDNPPFREVRLPLVRFGSDQNSKEASGGSNKKSYLQCLLPKATYVAAVMIRTDRLTDIGGYINLTWRKSGSGFTDQTQFWAEVYWPPDPMIIPIAETVSEIRITPGTKSLGSEIVLLIPELCLP